MEQKLDNVFRIGCRNIGGFPNEELHSEKFDILRAESAENGLGFDIQSFLEVNRRWSRVEEGKRFKDATRGWWNRASTTLSWLDDGGQGEFQYGGVATIMSHKLTSSRIEHKEDKMGRWTWATLRGKHSSQTTIISAYRPVKSGNAGSVETQQLRYMRTNNIHNIDPIQKFDKDLKQLIRDKRENGHKIILMGDFNIPMDEENSFTRMLKDLGLKEVILEKYHTEGQPAPPTFKHGTKKIDGIWVSEEVEIVKGGHGDLLSAGGDHCWVWIDVTCESLLGAPSDQFTKPVLKKLTCKIPTVREKFRSLLDQEYGRHKLVEKLTKLTKQGRKCIEKQGKISHELEKEYKKLSKLSEQSIKYADRNCKKARTGKVPFSTKTKELQGTIVVWKAILSHKSGKRRNLRYILRQSEKWNFRHRWGKLTIQEIRRKIKEARKVYKRFKPRAFSERRTYLGELANDIAEHDPQNLSAEHHYRQLVRQEDNRDSFGRIKYVLQPARSSVNRVEVEDERGNKILVKDKAGIEDAIAKSNISRLQQAHNTPLREEPLRSILGEQGNFQIWDKLMDGKITIPDEIDMTRGTKLWLQKVQNFKYRPNETHWTTEEYVLSWKLMKEQISSLPGPAFSHYKAATYGSLAAQVHSDLALFPLTTGYSPQGWRNAVASMIPKKKFDLRPEKLRLINLFHALYNHNNKWIGREIMKHGEENDLLAREQYGGRKSKSANQHALNKRLVLDAIRLQKLTAILIANDARSCYDRIIIMVAYIAMVMFGTSRKTARSSLFCLIVMRYVIRTVFGDSDLSYGGKKWNQTPHGMGQGNGCAPAVWNAISSPLFEILREEGYGLELIAPIAATALYIAGFGFVDDTDLIQGAKTNEDLQELITRTQGLLTLWEELLRVTGGALDVKDKSDWTLITFEWKNGKSELKKMDENITLKVRDHEGDIVNMKQIPATHARETLGVMQTPSGSEDCEVEYLLKKMKSWNHKIYRSTLRRQDITKAVNMTIVRTIRYGLVATALSFEQCDKLTRTLLKVALPKMGIVRTANNVLATAPTKYRGFGIIHFYILQMVDHLKTACDHGDNDTDTGQLLRTTLEIIQLQAGLGGNPLQIQPSKVPWIENSWWKNTLIAMERYKISLHGNVHELQKWTTNDSFLMDDLTSTYGSHESLAFYESVNRMRIFHRVVTRSDLQHACGKVLKTSLLSNVKERYCKTRSDSAYRWPKQGRPTISDVINWSLALEEMYGVKREQPIFPAHLRGRRWTKQSHSHQQWTFDQYTDQLYQKEGTQWRRWNRLRGTTRRQTTSFRRTEQMETRIDNLVPASVIKHTEDTVVMVGVGKYQQDYGKSQRVSDGLENSTDWMLQRVRLPQDGGKGFCEEIKKHEATTCGDGSFKSGKATGGSLSFNKQTMQVGIRVDNEIPIDPSDASAYAGELGGIGGIVLATNILCNRFEVTNGTVTHGVDNDAALANCFGPFEPTTATPCFHIVKRIRAEIKKSLITWKGKKVKAHQDDHADIEELDYWAKANIITDKQAKAHLRRVLNTDNVSSVQQFQDEGWTIQIGKKRITRHFEKQLIYHCTKSAIKQYWYERFDIDVGMKGAIDWEVFIKATAAMTDARRIFITKHTAGIAATGRNMLRRKEHDTSQCPRCGAEDEHIKHIFVCKGKGTKETFNTGIAEISMWLGKSTSTDIEDAIVQFLQNCRNEVLQSKWHEWKGPDDIKKALIEQELIGRGAFLSGVISKRWAQVQKRYFTKVGSRKCPIKWTATLTEKIIDIVADLWKHRNEALHKRDNVVRQKEHERLNREIIECMNQLPRSLRVFTAAEQRFFKRTKTNQLLKCKIRQKVQWIDTAQSIIKGFKENLHTNPQARIMWRAMNVTRDDDINKEENDDNDDNNEYRTEKQRTHNNEQNTQKTITRNQDENEMIQDDKEQQFNRNSKQNDKDDQRQIDTYFTKIKKDKKDENEPNG